MGEPNTKVAGPVLAAQDAEIGAYLSRLASKGAEQISAAQLRLKEAISNEGILLDKDVPCPVSLRPTIVRRAWVDDISASLPKILECFDLMLELYRSEPAVRDLFLHYLPVRDFILSAPSYRPLTRLCRFDGQINTSGEYRIIETNTDCPASLISTPRAVRIWQNADNPLAELIPKISNDQPVFYNPRLQAETLINTYKLCRGGMPTQARIVNYRGKFTSEVGFLIQDFLSLGVTCELIDICDITYKNSRMYHGNTAIDLIYNKWDLRDLVHAKEALPFLESVSRDEAVCINPLACQWLYADKTSLVFLSDPKYNTFLDPDLRSSVLPFIPWTRILKQGATTLPNLEIGELASYAKSHRDKLVVKPRDATWAEGVIVGRLVSSDYWKAFIDEHLLSGHFILQEYVSGHNITCINPRNGQIDERIADLNVYTFAGKFGGLMSRASTSPIMSLYKGGAVLPPIIA